MNSRDRARRRQTLAFALTTVAMMMSLVGAFGLLNDVPLLGWFAVAGGVATIVAVLILPHRREL
jgi:hypothetical protein